MKKLILLIGLTLTLTVAQAATVVGANKTAGHSRAIISQPAQLISLTVWSTNLAPTTVKLFDGDIVYTNAAFSNYVTAVANNVLTYTNSSGLTNNFTNVTVTGTWSTTAANTNNASPPIATIAVPGNNVPITFNVPLNVGRYLTLSNDLTGLSYIINYRTY